MCICIVYIYALDFLYCKCSKHILILMTMTQMGENGLVKISFFPLSDFNLPLEKSNCGLWFYSSVDMFN